MLADDDTRRPGVERPWEIDLQRSDSAPLRELRALVSHVETAVQLVESGRIRADAFIPVDLTKLGLPYRDPGDIPLWERRNGREILLLEPAHLPDRDGNLRHAFPTGTLPRLFLIWLTTEVKRASGGAPAGEPLRIELGESMENFMRQLGVASGGMQRRTVIEQLNRIIRSRITIMTTSTTAKQGGAWVDEGHQLSIASQWQLWHSGEDTTGAEALIGSWIEVTPQFRRAAETAVPLSSAVIQQLKSQPMRLDIYAWLVRRLYSLRTPETHVSWDQLAAQFGAAYRQRRQFKAAFTRHLQVVRIYYPEARAYATSDGLILRRSPRHIPERDQPRRRGKDALQIVRAITEEP